ncbi:MAG: ribosomal RNA small subunit methyltransferase A [Candidatus Omnitrophica bacterium]|nr:ribosomal RNA small subunit methyltransferase A [Candidatus Omnitrophota bacterium]
MKHQPFEFLKKYSVRPVKHLGQNFLIDGNVIQNIVDGFNPGEGETVVEVGPGLGALTQLMLERGARVLGVEKDPKLRAVLEKELAVYGDRFRLIGDDILDLDFAKTFRQKKVRVIGNLPYYLTSPLIFQLIEERKNVDSAVLMVQKEVADRILALPGTEDYGRLTVAVRFFADVKRLMNVSRKSFFPPPKIESSVILLEFRPESEIKKAEVDPEFFLEVVKIAFSQRRKNLVNCLHHAQLVFLNKEGLGGLLGQVGIEPDKRGEELFLKDFIAICRKLQELVKAKPKC